MNHDPNEHYAIFWDYENTPLSRQDFYETYLALKAFNDQHTIVFTKVYYRQISISPDDLKIIRLLPKIQTKCVQNNKKNAVDNVLMQSCRSVLENHPEITHVIILSGDGDFGPLIKDIRNRGMKTWLICRKKSRNRKCAKQANSCFFVQDLISAPQSWWKRYATKRMNPIRRILKPDRQEFILEDFLFITSRNYQKYVEHSEKETVIRCSICKKVFRTENALHQHRQNHRP